MIDLRKTELTPIDEPDEEFRPPAYGKPGRILVKVTDIGVKPFSWSTGFEYEVLDYDGDSGVFWINEGVGFEYWFQSYIEFPPGDGTYIIPNVRGEYIRGDGWTTDDDEDWEFDPPVPTDREYLD